MSHDLVATNYTKTPKYKTKLRNTRQLGLEQLISRHNRDLNEGPSTATLINQTHWNLQDKLEKNFTVTKANQTKLTTA